MIKNTKNWLTNFAVAWSKYWPPPARPTKSRVAFIKKIIMREREKVGRDNFKILILGSTSEFRDLMIELGIHPVIADFNRKNYSILARAMRHHDGNLIDETFIEANWLTMELNQKFDIILGDASFNVVPKKDNVQFLTNIKKHLTKSGLYVDAIWLRPNKKEIDIKKVINRRRDDLAKIPLYIVLNALLYLKVYDKKRDFSSFAKVAEAVEKLYSEGYFNARQMVEFRQLGMVDSSEFKFFMPASNWLNARLKKFFILKQVWVDDVFKYNPEYFPEFVLKNK